MLLSLVLLSVGTTPKEQPNGTPPPELKSVVTANNAFALDLYAQLRKTSGNLFLSPYSIFTALGMAEGGAAGKTERQMATVLHMPEDQPKFHREVSALRESMAAIARNKQVELNVANGLWVQQGFSLEDDFLGLLHTNYATAVERADFTNGSAKAVARINDWIENQTRGKIRNAVGPDSFTPDTRVAIVNAIYFKGKWASRFDERGTRNEQFSISQDKSNSVPTMGQTHVFRISNQEHVRILELPYVGGELSMLVLLPKDRDGLADLEKSLSAENLAKWEDGFADFTVDVQLPKLNFEREYSLPEPLMSMGMRDAFDIINANFTRMTTDGPVYIDKVVHIALVEVNEEGTVAAAATRVNVSLACSAVVTGPPFTVFHADHPFIFLIRDNHSGAILFLGRITNPK